MTEDDATMAISCSDFGNLDGRVVNLFTLSTAGGLLAKITNYGATLTELHVPDRQGRFADVVLGFANLRSYLVHGLYFGATVGRYGNRIRDGKFQLMGERHALTRNEGPNHLHGGLKGFDKVLWDAKPVATDDEPMLAMTYESPDGEEGYPGRLTATVVFSLVDPGEFRIDISATTDRPTVVNIVHHSYWNLSGRPEHTILDHDFCVNADHYTPTDNGRIPTGEIAPVADSPYDFRLARPIRRALEELPPGVSGYDINYVLNGDSDRLKRAARVHDPASGRVLEVYTTEPGLQFYDGRCLGGTPPGKEGVVYPAFGGFCLETQRFPDSPNQPHFPSAVLRPGQTYRHRMVHRFYVRP